MVVRVKYFLMISPVVLLTAEFIYFAEDRANKKYLMKLPIYKTNYKTKTNFGRV